ncbi:CPBP family intramembrane glutamic endopeptidase [Brevibacterium album]|uniref:CPBP family intramembrane glutamic endopeptidase n=1 Tax=Brevibacterium album TaxID=417948 RepID=UPI0004218EF5|nr:CPBP family intramembrane glutamic endopeptidase [Brevibacterium album]
MTAAADLPVTARRANPERHTSNQHRRGTAAALLLALAAAAGLAAVCLGFVLADAPVPAGAVLMGRWIPSLASLALLLLLPPLAGEPERLSRRIAHWWALLPGGPRPVLRIVTGSALAMILLTGVYLMAAGLAHSLGAIEMQPARVLVPALLSMIPIAVVFSVSTVGEEVVWRGHLPALLAPLGFWGSSAVIALAWTVFHLPLHAAYVWEGSISVATAGMLTAGLVPLSLFLSAAAARWGTVWPAVFAHALPFTAVSLAAGGAELAPEALGAVTGITAVLLVSAALVLAPVRAPRAV